MDARTDQALEHSQLIDMTTTGRRTGGARRIEIFLHSLDEGLFISGMPRPERRSWLANLDADPRLTLHLREPAVDLPARARVLTDPAERRRVLEKVAKAWRRTDVDTMVRYSPLIQVDVDRVAQERSAA